MKSAVNEKLATVIIDIELYNQLREHCDRNYIRFKDFVEESLENAIYANEMEERVNDAKKVLSEISGKCERVHMAVEHVKKDIDKAYRLGFRKGLSSIQENTDQNMKIDTFKPVKDNGQIQLFD